mmetsp:Transcript_30693/g.65222  ORF Transcript_30693/g.65222 Transcript_30693/m.65222 type:complete len:119 (+) Transcript_30693:1115-1471(+)
MLSLMSFVAVAAEAGSPRRTTMSPSKIEDEAVFSPMPVEAEDVPPGPELDEANASAAELLDGASSPEPLGGSVQSEGPVPDSNTSSDGPDDAPFLISSSTSFGSNSSSTPAPYTSFDP